MSVDELSRNRSKSRRFLGFRLRPRWGSLRRSPRPPSREGLLAFGNGSFAPSALNLHLAPPPQKPKIPAQLAPHAQNPRTATDPNSIRGHCLLADDIT